MKEICKKERCIEMFTYKLQQHIKRCGKFSVPIRKESRTVGKKQQERVSAPVQDASAPVWESPNLRGSCRHGLQAPRECSA